MRPSTARNGLVGDPEYIVRRKRWIPADSAVGSPLVNEENRTQVTPTPSASPYGWAGPLERHETQDPGRSDAVEARFQCVRVRAQARVHSRACPVRSRLALALATASEPGAGPGRTPGSDQARRPDSQEAWARSGAWPPRAQTGKARYLSALR